MIEKFKNFEESELETEIKSILQIIGNTIPKIVSNYCQQKINGKGKRKNPNIFYVVFKQFSANVEYPTQHEIASANAHLKPLGYRIICIHCQKYELNFLLSSDKFYAKMQKLDIKLLKDIEFKEWRLAKTFGDYFEENPDLDRSMLALFNHRTLQGFIFRNEYQIISIIKCDNEYETYDGEHNNRFSEDCNLNLYLIYCQLNYIKKNEEYVII